MAKSADDLFEDLFEQLQLMRSRNAAAVTQAVEILGAIAQSHLALQTACAAALPLLGSLSATTNGPPSVVQTFALVAAAIARARGEGE